MLVLDDLQWADESSLALFDFVARGPRPAPLCLIGAYRPDELRPRTGNRVPAAAADVIDRRIGRLSEATQAVTSAAAVGPSGDRLGTAYPRRGGALP